MLIKIRNQFGMKILFLIHFAQLSEFMLNISADAPVMGDIEY